MKRVLTMLGCLFIGNLSYAQSHYDHALNLPETEMKFYTVAPHAKDVFEKNIYIWGLGLNYPSDNYYEIGQKIARYNERLGQKMASDEFELWDVQQKARRVNDYIVDIKHLLAFKSGSDNKKYYNSCNRYHDQECIQKVINDQAKIEELNATNQKLQMRYEQLEESVNRSDEFVHPFSYAISPFPDFSALLSLTDLDLANAILDFSQGKDESGIKRLKRVNYLANLQHNGTLIFPLLQLNIQQALNQTLNALLDAKLIAPDLPLLNEILSQKSDRFDQKIRTALKWQGQLLMQNNLYLYQEYKDSLPDIMKDYVVDLEASREVAELFYDYYQSYAHVLDQNNVDHAAFNTVTKNIEGLPFNVSLPSPYEYLMQAQYQRFYECLLRNKVRVLAGDEWQKECGIQEDPETKHLFIDFKNQVEGASPLLPQPLRRFSQDNPMFGRLEVTLP